MAIFFKSRINQKQFPPYQRIFNMVIVPLFAILLFHECGHALFALFAGAKNISIDPFSLHPISKHVLDPRIPFFSLRSGLIFAGGAITTRLTAQIFHILFNIFKSPRWVTGIGGGISLLLRFDLPIQYLWGIYYIVFSPSGGLPDFVGLTQELFDNTLSKNVFYIVTGVLIMVDIIFSRLAITIDYKRAKGLQKK